MTTSCPPVLHTYHTILFPLLPSYARRHYLRELRDKQLAVRMLDESAEEVIKEYARRHVENCLTRAQAAIRGGGEGMGWMGRGESRGIDQDGEGACGGLPDQGSGCGQGRR